MSLGQRSRQISRQRQENAHPPQFLAAASFG
jgi:hypothetical protein